MRQLIRTILIAVVAMLLLVACGEDSQPQVDIDATVEARVKQSLPATSPAPVPTPTSIPQPELSELALMRAELIYWDKSSPLIERTVLEAGTPLAEIYLARYQGLVEGNLADWEAFVTAIDDVLPVYKSVLSDWVSIQPPSIGTAGEAHRAFGLAWGERIASLTNISVGWYAGDDDLLADGLARMETAAALGLEAEGLRIRFNTYLFDLCSVHRLNECS